MRDNLRTMYNFVWKIYCIYIIISVLLCIFGPWKYQNFDFISKFYVTLYMAFFLLLVACCCKIAFRYHIKGYSIGKWKISGIKLLRYLVVISFLVSTLYLVSNIQSNGFNTSFSSLAQSVASTYLERNDRVQYTPMLKIYILLNGFFYISVVAVILYKRYFSLLYRLLILLTIIEELINNTFYIGSNIGFARIFLLLAITTFFLMYKKGKKIDFRSFMKFAVAFFVFGFLISTFIYERIELVGSFFLLNDIDEENFIFYILPQELAYAVSLGISYLTQGYYGLSLCLQLPFDSCYGLGSSFAIRHIFEDMMGISDILTYPEKIERLYGIPAFAKWHTIFPWLASDFTFAGALLIMGMIAMVWGRTLKDGLVTGNVFSITLFYWLTIIMLFVPANNQVFQTTTTMGAFIISFFMWIARGHIEMPGTVK